MLTAPFCADAFGLPPLATRAIRPTIAKAKAEVKGKSDAADNKKKSPPPAKKIITVKKAAVAKQKVAPTKKSTVKKAPVAKKKVTVKKAAPKKKIVAKKKKPKPVPAIEDKGLAITKKLTQKKNSASRFGIGQKSKRGNTLFFSGGTDPTLKSSKFTQPDKKSIKNVEKLKAAEQTEAEFIRSNGILNPVEFGLRVIQSDKGKEAAAILVDGGLKFVQAVLEEGKQSKVEISRGYDKSTGKAKKPKVTNIGVKELVDAGLYGGNEFFDVAKKTYEKFYIGGEGEKANVKIRAAVIEKKSGKILKPATESYYVNIGGKRQLITKKR